MKLIKKANGMIDIEVNGIIVGGADMNEAETDDSFNYLGRIDIDEEYQGKGYGTAALYELAKMYGTYYLAPDNEDAKRLYERVATEVNDGSLYHEVLVHIDQGFGVYEM